MPTGYNVVWSDEASKNVDAILAYLEREWDRKTANDFLGELLKRVGLIVRQPEAFQKSESVKNARRSVLNKQITIYYRVDGQEVEILFLFDNRQDPEYLNLGS